MRYGISTNSSVNRVNFVFGQKVIVEQLCRDSYDYFPTFYATLNRLNFSANTTEQNRLDSIYIYEYTYCIYIKNTIITYKCAHEREIIKV